MAGPKVHHDHLVYDLYQRLAELVVYQYTNRWYTAPVYGIHVRYWYTTDDLVRYDPDTPASANQYTVLAADRYTIPVCYWYNMVLVCYWYTGTGSANGIELVWSIASNNLPVSSVFRQICMPHESCWRVTSSLGGSVAQAVAVKRKTQQGPGKHRKAPDSAGPNQSMM
jgi:hypothetical protein